MRWYIRGMMLGLGLLAGAAAPCAAQWEQVRLPLAGADVRCFAVLDGDLYAGTQGGVFRLPDGRGEWLPVLAGMSSRDVVSATALGSALFVGTADGALLRSSDRGATWLPVHAGIPRSGAIAALAASDGVLLAGNGRGVFRSTDLGANWSAPQSGAPSAAVFTLAAEDSIVLAGGISGSVSRSTDGGRTWTACTPLQVSEVRGMAFRDSVIVAASLRAIHTSSDAGRTWTPATGIAWPYAVAPILRDGARWYAGGERGGVYRSDDDGVTWQSVTGLDDSVAAVQALHILDGRLLAGSARGVLVDNGGSRLEWMRDGLTAVPVAAVHAFGGGRVFVSSAQGLLGSTDGGATFTPSDPVLDVRRIIAISGGYLAVGASGCFRSDDGRTWHASMTGLPPSTAVSDLWRDGDTIVIAARTAVYRSIDAGATWTDLSDGFPTGVSPVCTAVTAASGALFAGGDTQLWRRSRAGTAWESLAMPGPRARVFTLASHGSTVYVGTDLGLRHTPDAGASWIIDGAPLPEAAVYALMQAGQSVCAGMAGHGLFVSHDRGATWRDLSMGLPAQVTIRGLSAGAAQLWAATEDAGLWRRPLDQVMPVWTPPAAPAPRIAILSAIPHPVTGSAIVPIWLAHPGHAVVELYDELGARVAVLGDRPLPAGVTPVPLPAALAPGMYVCRVNADGERRARVVIRR